MSITNKNDNFHFIDIENINNNYEKYLSLFVKIKFCSQIKELFKKLSQCINLKILVIEGPVFNFKFSKKIMNLTKLEEIIIIPPKEHNRFENKFNINDSCLDYISNLPNIRHICINGYYIKNISKSIKNCKNTLTHLDLQDNNIITELPDELFECTNLKYLDISENYIHKINKNIHKLEKLNYLNILQKNIEMGHGKIPNEIGGLFNLTHFKSIIDGSFKKHYKHDNKILVTLSSYFNPSCLDKNITHLNILDMYNSGYTGNFEYLDNLPENLIHLKINPLLVKLQNLPISLKTLSITIKKDYDIENNIKLPFGCQLEIEYIEDNPIFNDSAFF
jgi:hypothetical protein